jgi:hypothetical protein
VALFVHAIQKIFFWGLEERMEDYGALTTEEIEKVMLVVMPKNQFSGHQKNRLFLVPPQQQKPTATEEAKKALKDVSELSTVDFPKFEFPFPPLQVRMKAEKMAGPGNSSSETKGKEKSEPAGYQSLTHDFYLVASVEGIPEEVSNAFGGADALYALQTAVIDMIKKASVQFERKRFFHPELLTSDEKTRIWTSYKKINKEITLEAALEAAFDSYLENRDACRIPGNFKPQPGVQAEVPGIFLKSKAWYTPKQVPKQADNEQVIEEYKKSAQEHGFKPNDAMILGFSKGFRHRRVPCFEKSKHGLEEVKQPIDPTQFAVRGGDWVMGRASYDMYATGTKGGTLHLVELIVVYQPQPNGKRNRPMDSAVERCPPSIICRGKKQKTEGEGDEILVQS